MESHMVGYDTFDDMLQSKRLTCNKHGETDEVLDKITYLAYVWLTMYVSVVKLYMRMKWYEYCIRRKRTMQH